MAASGARLAPEDILAAPSDAEAALQGTTVEVASADRRVRNRLQFLPDGVVYIVPESRRAVRFPARWEIRDNWLCVNWRPRGAECWPYEQGFRVGEPVTLTSNRGQTVHVTLISTRESGGQGQSHERP